MGRNCLGIGGIFSDAGKDWGVVEHGERGKEI